MHKALKIAVVVGSGSRQAGGLFESVRRRALQFNATGHDVTVVALKDEFSEEDISAWLPLRPVMLETSGPAALGYSPSFERILTSKRFDIIHQHGIWQAFSSAVAAARDKSGVPVMISAHGMLDPWAVRHSAWKKRIASALYERANLKGSACLHALNSSEAEAMREYGLKNPIAILPNGTDVPSGVVRPGKLKWWPSGRVLLFLGRLHPKKGIAELIEAFALFRLKRLATLEQWTLVIAGWDDGGHQAAMEALVQKRGLSDYVIFPGPLFHAAKDAAFANSNAFILPSFSEGLPMAVLEAWSWGLPAFITEACNLPEGFAAKAAIQIDTDVGNIANALAHGLSLPSTQLREMGIRGRTLVADRFLWTRICEQHIETYRWMIEGSPLDAMPGWVRGGVLPIRKEKVMTRGFLGLGK